MMFTGMPVSLSYEKLLLDKIIAGDTSSFSVIFSNYYKDLVTFSYGLTKDLDAAEEIVQDIFVRLWENRSSLHVEKSLKSYLLKSVQNRSLNWLHHRRVHSQYAAWVTDHPALFENDTEQIVLHSELEDRLERALDQLPPEVADAFRLHRMENLTYPEIALKRGVSVRTIEVRISRALSLLREALRDFLGVVILFFLQRF